MPALSSSAVQRIAADWLLAKTEEKRWTDRQAEKNGQLKTLMFSHGVQDPNDGHYYLDVTLPDGTTKVVQMQMRGGGVLMDEDLAAELLAEAGALEEYSAWEVTVLDNDLAAEQLKLAGLDDGQHGFAISHVPTEDSVRDAYYAKVLTEVQYSEIFTEAEKTPALYIQDGHK
jgi:hypothetical protein